MKFLVYIFRYSKSKIIHVRFLAFLIVILTISMNFQAPVRDFTSNMNYPCSIWTFPFLMAKDIFATICFFAMIYVNADVPFMQNSNMYHLVRMGRIKWGIAQIIMIFLRSSAMVLTIVFCSIISLFPNIEFSFEWGKVIYTLAGTSYGSLYNFKYPFFYTTLNSFRPVECMFITILILVLLYTLLSLLMYVLCLYWGRILSVVITTAYCFTIFLIQNIHPFYMMRMSSFFSPIWTQVAAIHELNYGYGYLPSISYMIIFLIIAIIGLSILILYKLKHIQLSWEKETY